ncbi:MAG: BON domain-containing protein [Gammaproteobacteria bacterium]|nr:BON domain-containing protein [Gammaproteobacteria bacterium]
MFKKTVLAATLGCILVGSQAMAANEQYSDTWLEASLTTAYTLNRHLNPFEIDVEVRDGVAHLQGSVDSEVEKDLAAQIALGLDGVQRVDNGLVVEPGTERRTQSDSFARTFEDASITARVRSQLMWNSGTDGLQIKVSTENGVVSLSGPVESAAERSLAREIASGTAGVLDVRDRMTLREASAEKDAAAGGTGLVDAVGAAGREVGDAWLSTKVKSALLYSRRVDGLDIDVQTEAGVVTLTGSVSDESELNRAMRIARGIDGVKSVRSQLEVSGEKSS